MVLQATGIAPHRLHLELTESSVASDDEEVLRTLRALKKLGATLSIDDFGTGYSSLSYVQRFPLDVLKIDRSFVAPIGPGGGQELAAGILAMARALGLRVVAEGIETRHQFRVLRDLGCEHAQGFHFSRPEPAAIAERFFRLADDEPSAAWPSASNREPDESAAVRQLVGD